MIAWRTEQDKRWRKNGASLQILRGSLGLRYCSTDRFTDGKAEVRFKGFFSAACPLLRCFHTLRFKRWMCKLTNRSRPAAQNPAGWNDAHGLWSEMSWWRQETVSDFTLVCQPETISCSCDQTQGSYRCSCVIIKRCCCHSKWSDE